MINITEEQLKEIVTQAHMAGQHNQTGCDPSYFEAESHWQKQVKNLGLFSVSGSFSAVDCKNLMYYGTLKDGSVKIDDGTKHLDYFLHNVFDIAKDSTRFNVKEAVKMFWSRIEALANYR